MNGQQDLICPNPSSSDEGLFLSPGQGQEARCREQHPEREPGQAWGNIHKPNHELGLIRLEKMDVCSGYSDIPSVTSQIRGVDTKSGKVREAEALLPEWP